jgi:hypothetical protein
MAKPGLTLDHAGQFQPGDRVFVTRYGEREDWAYPVASGAKMTAGDLQTFVLPIPAMPQVIEVTLVSIDPITKVAEVLMEPSKRGDAPWLVPIGYVKTAEWVSAWQPVKID